MPLQVKDQTTAKTFSKHAHVLLIVLCTTRDLFWVDEEWESWTDVKDSKRKRSMKVISYLCCWLTLGFYSTLWHEECGERGRDVKNLKSTLLDEKINEVSTASSANAQDLRCWIFASHPTHPLCISTQNGSLMHCCETFSLSWAWALFVLFR